MNGTMYETGGAIPGPLPTELFSIAFDNIDSEVRYFVRIGVP